jgi:hypothetical protein
VNAVDCPICGEPHHPVDIYGLEVLPCPNLKAAVVGVIQEDGSTLVIVLGVPRAPERMDA